jgi:GDP-L-fucose synthase
MELHDKIYIAGHRGLVGSALVKKLTALGYDNLLLRDRTELDLEDAAQVERFFQLHAPDYVFDAAAKVGGIHSNNTYSAEFIYKNTLIQNNLIHYSWKHGVKKFLFLGSVCIYPKFAAVPVTESSLLTGELEPTNEAYAIAKIHGIKMCEAYYKQYGFASVCIMPSNLYGVNDNFHTENGHVIPAMMQKFHSNKQGTVTLWGDGSPCREFLHSDDMASACVFLMQHANTGSAELVNAGSGENISIMQLSEMLKEITGFTGNIVWDTTRPNGTPNRPLDSSKILAMGWRPQISLHQGLREVYNNFANRQRTLGDQAITRR